VAQRQSQPRDLGRMPQDIADSQRR